MTHKPQRPLSAISSTSALFIFSISQISLFGHPIIQTIFAATFHHLKDSAHQSRKYKFFSLKNATMSELEKYNLCWKQEHVWHCSNITLAVVLQHLHAFCSDIARLLMLPVLSLVIDN